MKIYYDEETDAAYIRLSDEQPSGVVEVSEGVNLDLTEDGRIVGIEILDAAKKSRFNRYFHANTNPS
jgi:uncharacterized protein YuzE